MKVTFQNFIAYCQNILDEHRHITASINDFIQYLIIGRLIFGFSTSEHARHDIFQLIPGEISTFGDLSRELPLIISSTFGALYLGFFVLNILMNYLYFKGNKKARLYLSSYHICLSIANSWIILSGIYYAYFFTLILCPILFIHIYLLRNASRENRNDKL